MENFLCALAFAGLIAAQFLAVVFANTQVCEDPTPGSRKRIARVPVCGSLAHSARKAFLRPWDISGCSETSRRASDKVSRPDIRQPAVTANRFCEPPRAVS